MHVNPAIAALRTDRGPQRHAQSSMLEAIEEWKKEPGAGELLSELQQFGQGAPLEACPQLEAVFTAQGEGERLMGLLSRHYCAALAANPFGHPPFRSAFDGRSSSLLLASSGPAQLMIQSREPGEYSQESYVLCDSVRYDAVLAGSASARILRKTNPELSHSVVAEEPLELGAGDRLALDLSSEVLITEQVRSRFVVLRLLRSAQNPEPGREFSLLDGSLRSQIAGNLATSRQEAIVALLGRMGRADSAPAIAALALGEDADTSLRWQAVRECLALDTETGFRTLMKIARRSDDALAGSAGALRAKLLEAHPQLLQLEERPCPA